MMNATWFMEYTKQSHTISAQNEVISCSVMRYIHSDFRYLPPLTTLWSAPELGLNSEVWDPDLEMGGPDPDWPILGEFCLPLPQDRTSLFLCPGGMYLFSLKHTKFLSALRHNKKLPIFSLFLPSSQGEKSKQYQMLTQQSPHELAFDSGHTVHFMSPQH